MPVDQDTSSEPVSESAAVSELDGLAPLTGSVVLSDGSTVKLKRLKARQFFALLRILTHGGADYLPSLMRPDLEQDQFVGQFLAIVVLAIPDAPEETAQFLWEMVEKPDERLPNGKPNPLYKVLQNKIAGDEPEIEDWIALVHGIVQQEKDDLVSLGKRLQAMLGLAEKTGQLKTS